MNGLISLSLKLFLLMFFLTLSCFTLAHAKPASLTNEAAEQYSHNDQSFPSSFLPA